MALVIYFLETKDDIHHTFKPYYDILPKSVANNPLLWTPNELLVLKGSPILKTIKRTLKKYKDEYQVWSRVSDTITFENYVYANVVVNSRNFSITM